LSKAIRILSGLLVAILVAAAIPTCDCGLLPFGHHEHAADHGADHGAVAAADHDTAGHPDEACTEKAAQALLARAAVLRDAARILSSAILPANIAVAPPHVAGRSAGAALALRPPPLVPSTPVVLRVLLRN